MSVVNLECSPCAKSGLPSILLVSAPHSFGWPWGRGNLYRGFYEYLGTGYLAAACEKAGIHVEILDAPYHGWGPERTAEEVKRRNPDVIGISANWQEFFPQAASLLVKLKDVNAPIILGGHFPTIAHEYLLRDFPWLKAVCIGEGEFTLVEAVNALAAGRGLSDVPGLAFRQENAVIRTCPRPLVEDLDSLPFPKRPQAKRYRKNKNPGVAAANILSSRGCRGNCSFCTVHAFQKWSPGPRWRARSPENVVEEMLFLNREYGFTHFRFVDEDFFGRSQAGRERSEEIAREILRKGLRPSFEIFCRADEVDPDILKLLKEAGLSAVYLSLDAVSESDIEFYNKETTRSQMVNAVRYVIESGVKLAYSFIFWHPFRKLGEIKEAFALLDEAASGDIKKYNTILQGMETGIISDLVVLTGSPLEERLKKDGLLRGNYMNYTYEFVDPATRAAYALLKPYKRVRNTIRNMSNLRWIPHKSGDTPDE